MENLTQKFVEKLTGGFKKEAEYAVNSYVRYRLKENGIVRSPLLPPLEISNAQLDKDKDNPRKLMKLMEIEPDTTAVSIPFRGHASREFIKSEFLPVYFEKITSKEHIVELNELRNYSNDLRKILDEMDVKEIQRQEDEGFIRQLFAIAAANPTEQDLPFYGGLTKNTWSAAQQAFFIDKPLKYALMNTRTFKEFLKWDYVRDFGYGTDGANAYKGIITNPHGINIIQTIKDDLVPDGKVIFFAPEDFIGKFFVLQPPTTYVEQRKSWINFSTEEVIGIGIGNTRCFTINTFNP